MAGRLRTCEGNCGRVLVMTNRFCHSCRTRERPCVECGNIYTGNHRKCKTCQGRQERTCEGCNLPFRGTNVLCGSCCKRIGVCATCSKPYRGSGQSCLACYRAAHPEVTRQKFRESAARRNDRIKNNPGSEGLSREDIRAIVAGENCVYCGLPAQECDHVLSIATGGADSRSNAVPCCTTCNQSKRNRLLADWFPCKVARARIVSEVVENQWRAQAERRAVAS